jgi:hypothetical protein
MLVRIAVFGHEMDCMETILCAVKKLAVAFISTTDRLYGDLEWLNQ